MIKKKSNFRKIIASRSLFYLLILVLIFSLITAIQEINQQIKLKKELSKLEAQNSLLEKENKEAIDKIEKMQTDYFQEKVAREKLGLQKPGEQVVVITSQNTQTDQTAKSINKSFNEKISNLKNWFNYFFPNSSR
ncbi:MAG: septum formation initiator family protein [Patescibacteria group bacterium]|nr:septum formation initiator family protein [Patescibacteria group bacterium]MDD5164147.1 septum formation initiator family protein [Patescibacteria group bacterium]MDD5534519.1 septum formation initiator family protein [Patescibacteria group bacterium]